jgi:hypothetical protein
MKWISVDIGIKNMAYCILTLENNEINVVDWNVINLIEPVNPTVYMCSCLAISKSSKSKNVKHSKRELEGMRRNAGEPNSFELRSSVLRFPEFSRTPSASRPDFFAISSEFMKNANTTAKKPCNKKATYQKNQEYYCDTHAKTHSEYCIPTKEHTLAFLRKKKVAEITELYASIFPETTPPTKPAMIDAIFAHYTSKLFTVLPKPTKKNANDTDLISIGWAIKREFDNLEHLSGVTHVVIENQISPIATRMKTIQGMLAQYFIMRSGTLENVENTQIHFVSSSNKLKMSEPNHKTVKPTDVKPTDVKPTDVKPTDVKPTDVKPVKERSTDENPTTISDKTSYRKNKQDGIALCSRYLANNTSLMKWAGVLQTTKKDDLADCFLQGIWFMYNQKIITYAENLKINSV